METVFHKIADAIEQDIAMWVVVAFTCAVLVWIAALIDLWTGVEAARANKEPISSHALRRTVAKVVDYLRVMLFCALIDTLGLFFSWYVLPYFVIVCTLGILLIEGRSVLGDAPSWRTAGRRRATRRTSWTRWRTSSKPPPNRTRSGLSKGCGTGKRRRKNKPFINRLSIIYQSSNHLLTVYESFINYGKETIYVCGTVGRVCDKYFRPRVGRSG